MVGQTEMDLEEYCNNTIQEYDINEDGKLSFDEFQFSMFNSDIEHILSISFWFISNK